MAVGIWNLFQKALFSRFFVKVHSDKKFFDIIQSKSDRASTSSLIQRAKKNNLFQPCFFTNSNSLFTTDQILQPQIRTLIKFSSSDGKRETVEEVPQKFFRLHWGIWIRTIAGRHKKLWKKSASQRNRLKQHVFCNATQCRMLDTMVSKYWRKPKYYIEDPYEHYHKREEFSVTRKKPWRPDGCDYE